MVEHRLAKARVAGSNPVSRSKIERSAQIAQSVEQRTENPRVAGSIPALGIKYMQKSIMYTEAKNPPSSIPALGIKYVYQNMRV